MFHRKDIVQSKRSMALIPYVMFRILEVQPHKHMRYRTISPWMYENLTNALDEETHHLARYWDWVRYSWPFFWQQLKHRWHTKQPFMAWLFITIKKAYL